MEKYRGRRHPGHRFLQTPDQTAGAHHDAGDFYIHNRYSFQRQIITIEELKKELTDIKYDALTRSSELMEQSRQSRIEEYIATQESDLQTATTPPYLIRK